VTPALITSGSSSEWWWGVWLEIKAASNSSECILALGDNTSAIGWLFQSGRVGQNSLSYAAIQQVARHLATLILDSDHCLASQHLKGEKNIVADLLSYTGSTRGHAHPLAADEPSDEVLVNSRTGTRASMCAPKRAPPRGTPRHKPRANRYVNYSNAKQRSPL
jgi:hypothetical protein